MSEKSLWCYPGGICWKSGLRNLPFSRAPGKVVHEVVSHLKQCNKTVQRWWQSLCSFHSTGAWLWKSWVPCRSMVLGLPEYSKWTLGMCRRSLPSEHIRSRALKPFPPAVSSSCLCLQEFDIAAVDSGKYLKGPDPFSQSRQKKNLDLRDSNIWQALKGWRIRNGKSLLGPDKEIDCA